MGTLTSQVKWHKTELFRTLPSHPGDQTMPLAGKAGAGTPRGGHRGDTQGGHPGCLETAKQRQKARDRPLGWLSSLRPISRSVRVYLASARHLYLLSDQQRITRKHCEWMRLKRKHNQSKTEDQKMILEWMAQQDGLRPKPMSESGQLQLRSLHLWPAEDGSQFTL